MDRSQEDHIPFPFLDLAGVGLVGCDREHHIRVANSSALRYLDQNLDDITGQEITVLKAMVQSPEFWEGIFSPLPFYCIAPARDHLLLLTSQSFPHPSQGAFQNTLLLRPWSLEREFIGMKSRLSRNLNLEIGSRLNSIGVASEIILEPELVRNHSARSRVLSIFTQDIRGLSNLFSEVVEITDLAALSGRMRRNRLDWQSLVSDLLKKMEGLAGDRSISLTKNLPSTLPSPLGDYHWLYLALFGVMHHLLFHTPPLSEIKLTSRVAADTLETTILFPPPEAPEGIIWPPLTLFPIDEKKPGFPASLLSDLAISRSILRLHQGELQLERGDSQLSLRFTLPI